MHPALMLDLQHLGEAWGLLSVVAVIVWSVDRVRNDYMAALEQQANIVQPTHLRLIDGQPRMYDWARDEVA